MLRLVFIGQPRCAEINLNPRPSRESSVFGDFANLTNFLTTTLTIHTWHFQHNQITKNLVRVNIFSLTRNSTHAKLYIQYFLN